MKSRAYLPLRSNAAWFEAPDAREELERRLKVLLITHDAIVPQDGRYTCSFWMDGVGVFELFSPPAMFRKP